jgi:UDPglucose 6-dehydrogenase
MKIAIIGGLGYVGKAMTEFLCRHYQTVVFDIGSDPETIKDAKVAVICVPTPSLPDGRCDTSIVETAIGACCADLTIIKSTVEPGTTDRLREKTNRHIVFAPEYCGESSYWSPYKWDREIKESPFFIFGGSPEDTAAAVDLYMPVVGPTKKYIQTTAKAAEMAKYMENAFYATKITFAYEMAAICKAAGLDYNLVREIWLNDPRINPMHTAVFKNNKKPFGGKCLPKDTTALANYAETLGYTPQLLYEVLRSNERIGEWRSQ